MKHETIIKKIESITDWETFLNYIEECLKQGMTTGNIVKHCPVKLSVGVMNQILDIWYPGYSELSVPERRKWILEQWPILSIDRKMNWRSNLYDPTHPIYKYFTRFLMQAFIAQRHSAKRRGIEWKFDFLSWIVWWIQTGKLDHRGVTNIDYQMCRINDVGPYSWENVYCDTGKNNKETYWNRNKPKEVANNTILC